MDFWMGYFADANKSTFSRSKVHICRDGKPICGCFSKRDLWSLAKGIHLPYVECKHCLSMVCTDGKFTLYIGKRLLNKKRLKGTYIKL